MTAHGVTRPSTWDLTARLDSGVLVGTARTSFDFDTFDMEKPSVFFLLSVEDNIRLELDLVARLNPEG
jgi:hypothetical protein